MSVSKVDLDRLYVLGGLGATCFMPSHSDVNGSARSRRAAKPSHYFS